MSTTLTTALPTRAETRRLGFQRFTVDLWFTDLNPTEVGIFRKSRQRAKSRQFTADADVFGEVQLGGERRFLLSYRKALWQEATGMDKRLVIKLFTPSMGWRGTLDFMLARSLELSHGAGGFPVTAFSINLDGHDQLIQVIRSPRKWPGCPESFSFFILTDGVPAFYRLRRNWIAIGDDYTIYDQTGAKIGAIDGKLISLGGKWHVTVRDDHAGGPVNLVLQMFCGMLRFNAGCQDHVSSLIRDLRKGRLVPQLQAQEFDLYMNPRRVR